MEVLALMAFLVAMSGQRTDAWITQLMPLPPELQENFDMCHGGGDLRYQSGQLVFWISVQPYLSRFTENLPYMSYNQTQSWRRQVYNIVQPLMPGQNSRHKRQATARIRREIRSLSTNERTRYFNALNAMKRDTRFPPNVYDFLAGFHRGANVRRAHNGPAFASWHRLYLYIFESVLREYDASVTVPFWASDIDNEMTDPTQSVIWSNAFFGNGVGEVNSGPLAGWGITRNIGNGQLFSFTGVDAILRRTRNSEILLPTALADSNLEMQHGGPHNFVGGTMNDLQAAAFDPIFFSHHAYVDYIWERFRQGQQRVGINPETDYPFRANDPRFRPSHGPERTAGFERIDSVTVLGIPTENLIQRIGYSNRFFDLVRYIETPQCPDCANSLYFICNSRNRCESITIATMEGSILFNPRPAVAPRRRIRASNIHRSEIANFEKNMCSKNSLIHDVNTNRLANRYASSGWVYIPIRVVTKRSEMFSRFPKYSLYTNNRRREQVENGLENEFLRKGTQKCYDSCPKKQGVSGKIMLVSYGLNFDGYSEEFVVVDNRYGVAEGYGFLPVKRPSERSPTDIIIGAFDQCGRACRPYCGNQNPGYPNINTGAFRVTSEEPRQYEDSYEQAMLSIWNIESPSLPPTCDGAKIPITFFCEFTDKWLWNATGAGAGERERLVPRPGSGYSRGSVGRHTLEHCTVAPDCVIAAPCRGCLDFDYRPCQGGRKLAVCMYGRYIVTRAGEREQPFK